MLVCTLTGMLIAFESAVICFVGFATAHFISVSVSDKAEKLCKLHHDKGNKDKSESDEVHIRFKIYKSEYRVESRNKENKANECKRKKCGTVELFVSERTYLKE